jgi:hypothetical protein
VQLAVEDPVPELRDRQSVLVARAVGATSSVPEANVVLVGDP